MEHLVLWRKWSETPGHVFAGMVDIDRIALVGHSRGGEAVALAAAYNNLPYDPTNAGDRFDFGFNIRSLAAVAPVDGMYKPVDRPVPVQGVNYMLLTGMHDADVADLAGGRTYERVRLDDGQFKTALHIYGANHGQFNTTRSDTDLPLPFSWLINRRPLLAAEAQRQATLVYLSAFLEATMNHAEAYVAMFRDHGAAADWLPQTMYISHYADSSYRTVANFAEDLNLTTTTAPGGRIDGSGLAAWREETLPTIYNETANFGAFVAWDTRDEQGAGQATAASLTIALPDRLHEQWGMDEDTVLVLSLVDGRLPEDGDEAGEADDVDDARDGAVYGAEYGAVHEAVTGTGSAWANGSGDRALANRASAEAWPGGPEPIDFTVKLTFADGGEASLPLRRFGTLWPTPPVKRLKIGFVEHLLMGATVLPQRFELPIAVFAELAGATAATIRSIELVFDVTSQGALYIDEIAIAQNAFIPGR